MEIRGDVQGQYGSNEVRVTVGSLHSLQATVGHLRVTVGHLRVTVGHFGVTIGHLRVSQSHLRIPIANGSP